MGSVVVVHCHLDAWAVSGMKTGKKIDEVHMERRHLSILVEDGSKFCCSHNVALIYVRFDQSHVNRHMGGRRRGQRIKEEERSSPF